MFFVIHCVLINDQSFHVCICCVSAFLLSQNPSLGENSSTNSLKLTLPSPVLSHFCVRPCSSRSVAKNPLLARKSLISLIESAPLLFTSMKPNACFRLKYGLYLRDERRTSQALSHLKRAAQRLRNSVRVSAVKN